MQVKSNSFFLVDRSIIYAMIVHFRRNAFELVYKRLTRMASEFNPVEKSMKEIRGHLIKFTGGSVVLIKRDDGLAVVVLNQPKKKNAISGKMMVDFHDVVEELSSWKKGKGVILKGSSGNFCSGGDLGFVKQIATPTEGYMMASYMQNILNKFQRLPLISVALIEGAGALGGGAELSVACDFILTTQTCNGIGFVHARLGIIPAWGGTNRLVEKIGYTNALDLMSTAKILNPQDCLKIGLVNDIIPDNENPENYTVRWLQKRTQFDSNLIRNIKSVVSQARDYPRDYEKEKKMFAPFWGNTAHKEALEKFLKITPELLKQ